MDIPVGYLPYFLSYNSDILGIPHKVQTKDNCSYVKVSLICRPV